MVRAVESKSIQPKADMTQKPSPAKPGETVAKQVHLHLVDGPVADNARIGDRLKAARLSKALELDDIARQLHLRREYITAIEAMQASQLPKGFVNPYIRSYAMAVGLDPEFCVTSFNQQCGALSQASAEQIVVSKSNSHAAFFRISLAVIGLLIAGGLGYAGFQFATSKVDEPVVEASPAIPVTPSLDGANTPVTSSYETVTDPARRFNLEIRAEHRAWIEIRGADGTLFVDRQLSKGEVYDLRVGAGWTLTTQDAGAFVWLADGHMVLPVGEADQPLYTLGIDAIAADIQKTLDEQAAADAAE